MLTAWLILGHVSTIIFEESYRFITTLCAIYYIECLRLSIKYYVFNTKYYILSVEYYVIII